jgi:hypothetical protein
VSLRLVMNFLMREERGVSVLGLLAAYSLDMDLL